MEFHLGDLGPILAERMKKETTLWYIWLLVKTLKSNFMLFKVIICIKKLTGSLFLIQTTFFYQLKPFEIPKPDKMPRVNVKTKALPVTSYVKQ